jgi:hypothetical protein
MDTLIGEAIVMFAFNKVFRANKRNSPLYGSDSGGIYRQDLSYRVFPEAKDVFPRKGQIIRVFPPYKPPLAVLLNGISSRDKTKTA